jgi:integrase
MDAYELRHFCGSHLADLGVSAQDIAHQLGHTDGGRKAQEVYIHTYEDRARDRLRRAFENNVTPLRPVDDDERQSQIGSTSG